MQYHNNTSEALLINADSVTIGIKGTPNVELCGNCKIIKRGDKLIADVIPRLNAKYISELPSDAIVSQSSDGEIGVFIERDTPAAILIRRLWKDRDRLIAESN